MSLKDITNSLLSRVRNGRDRSAENLGMTASLPNGGFTGYRPKVSKGDVFSTASMTASPGDAAPMNGMQPPVQDQTAWQNYQNPQGMQNMQQPMNPFWQGAAAAQQPAAQEQPYEAGGAQLGYMPGQQQTAHQMNAPQNMQQPAEQPVPGVQPQQTVQNPAPNNISYMPGTFVGSDGQAYSHVERVVQLMNVQACFRIIEFMRNSESVIVNTEAIISDADIQRCLDMLAGAAFTLGCTLTKITQLKRAYLIAPRNVLVMQDAVVSHWSEPEVVAQAAPEMSGYGQPAWQQEQHAYAQQGMYSQPAAVQQPASQTAYVPPVSYPQPQMSWSSLAQQAESSGNVGTAQQTAYSNDTYRSYWGKPATAAAGTDFMR